MILLPIVKRPSWSYKVFNIEALNTDYGMFWPHMVFRSIASINCWSGQLRNMEYVVAKNLCIILTILVLAMFAYAENNYIMVHQAKSLR